MDYLNSECEKFGVKLIYSNNKVLILSCTMIDAVPIIKANEIFKKCSREVADAIIDYYTNLKHDSSSTNIINDFIKLNYAPSKYKIKSPNKVFLDYFEAHKPTLVEYEISEITKNHFYGNAEKVNADSAIKTSDDDIVELNIVVKPPAT